LDAGWYFLQNGKRSYSHDKATWGTSVGAEFPYKWISVTPRISYDDDFERTAKSDQVWQYGVSINSWITPKIGVYAHVTYVAWQHSTDRDWVYGTGLRVRF
jgi:hypothetical protein